MFKNEVVSMLEELIGNWSTDKNDIQDMVADIMENADVDFCAEDFGDYVSVQFEDDDENDEEVIVQYELVGRNTWTVVRVF